MFVVQIGTRMAARGPEIRPLARAHKEGKGRKQVEARKNPHLVGPATGFVVLAMAFIATPRKGFAQDIDADAATTDNDPSDVAEAHEDATPDATNVAIGGLARAVEAVRSRAMQCPPGTDPVAGVPGSDPAVTICVPACNPQPQCGGQQAQDALGLVRTEQYRTLVRRVAVLRAREAADRRAIAVLQGRMGRAEADIAEARQHLAETAAIATEALGLARSLGFRVDDLEAGLQSAIERVTAVEGRTTALEGRATTLETRATANEAGDARRDRVIAAHGRAIGALARLVPVTTVGGEVSAAFGRYTFVPGFGGVVHTRWNPSNQSFVALAATAGASRLEGLGAWTVFFGGRVSAGWQSGLWRLGVGGWVTNHQLTARVIEGQRPIEAGSLGWIAGPLAQASYGACELNAGIGWGALGSSTSADFYGHVAVGCGFALNPRADVIAALREARAAAESPPPPTPHPRGEEVDTAL